MKNNDLYALRGVIARVKGSGSNKFKLPLIINEKLIDERIAALEEMAKPSPRAQEYEAKQREITAQHAELDGESIALYAQPIGQGERVYTGYGYPNITRDAKGFDAKAEALRKEYHDTLLEEEAKGKAFEETLTEEVTPPLELQRIPFDLLPEMEYDDLKVMMVMVEG